MSSLDKNANPAVKVSDLSLGYQQGLIRKAFPAVEGISFDVAKGSTLAVLGESGSGKSTLITYLAGRATSAPQKSDFIQNISGEAWSLGVPLHRLKKGVKRKLTAFVGFMEQDAGAKLSPELNIGDLIFEPIEERIKNFDRKELGEDVARIFDELALPLNFLQKYPYELSKGQRQRVAVARVLLTEPSLLILDEPTLGVDAINRPNIVKAIRNFKARIGATVLFISHDIGMLEGLTNNVLVLQQGTPVGYGNINEIFRNAESGYVFQLAQALRSTAYDEVANE